MVDIKNSNNLNGATIGENASIHIGNIDIHKVEKTIIFNEAKLKELLEKINEDLLIATSNNEFSEKSNINGNIKINRDTKLKNERHLLSENNYTSIIIPQMDKYHLDITNFFRNPRNKKLNSIYKIILTRFNTHLRANKNKYDSILDFFETLTKEMYQDHRKELEKYEDDFLDILVYYMYYNCDLDKGE